MKALAPKWPAIARRGRGVDYLERIATREDWRALHARPGHHTVARTETVKFLIDLLDGDKTYFLDAGKWEVHFDFVHRFLDPYADYDRFNLREYTQADRRYALGSVMHYLDGDHWPVELSGGDTLPAERIAWMLAHVTARVACAPALKFRPVSLQQIAQASQLAADVPVLGSESLNASVVYQPVVLGASYGHVRLMRGALEVSDLRPTDIVVTERVPEQMPPVAALVTSQLQAPLAHVAVLCRNRHTPDMALRGAIDREVFTRLEGQLVKLSVAAQDYAVEPAALEEARAAWAASRPATGWRPEADLRMRDIVDVARLPSHAARFVGAKAAQMGQLARLEGLRTAGGFALPFAAYQAHLASAGLEAEIDAMLGDSAFGRDAGVRSGRLAALRAAIQRQPVAPALLADLCQRLQPWAMQGRTLLRSSTNAEDLDGFNGAGLYDSVEVPARPSPDQVADALRQVWASVWLQRAFEEQDWYRIDHRAVALGVLVQPFVEEALATGVAITGNPFKQGIDAVFINTQRSGATVTGALGNQLPGQYLVATWTGVLEPELISRSSLLGGAPILRETELSELTAQLQRIHRTMLDGHTGSANEMDVEFALTRERRFVILQARPYRIVYSLDRTGRTRARAGGGPRMRDRLRRLAYRLRQGGLRPGVLGGRV
ncbi:MAG: PEP/pyruvate-binding domain-containing protein [Rubrivivax sp.]